MPSQPQDEWIYLRAEEFTDDDAVESVEAVFDTGAEDAALHPVDPDEPQVSAEALDPGQTLGDRRRADAPSMQYFDDEEPERIVNLDGSEPDVEPGLDDILTSQHYSFEPDSQ
jgi:hypothetical protein